MRDLEVVAEFSGLLAAGQFAHAVGGSLASSAWGEARYTNDADIAIALPEHRILQFLELLPDCYYCEPSDVISAVQDRGLFPGFQVLYEPTVFKIDCFLAREAWSLTALDRAVPLELSYGVIVPYATAEDMIIAKCRWFDLGRRVSDRQWNDLVRLYEVQRHRLDVPYIEKWLSEFGLGELWQAIVSQGHA